MNEIHPTAIIGKNVIMGTGNKILPYTIIEGPCEIGNNNIIGPHAIVGCPPTDTKFVDMGLKNPKVKIGDNNIIREFSVVEQPCYEEQTVIEDNVFIMQGVNVSHDVYVKKNAVLTKASALAGIVKILDGANVAMASAIVQYMVIGHYSIVGANATCMKNVKPFSRYIPNKPLSVNYYAVKKFGFEPYMAEIESYVLNDIMPKSDKLQEIIREFDFWVHKYKKSTY